MKCVRMSDECGLRKSDGDCNHSEPLCKSYEELPYESMRTKVENLKADSRQLRGELESIKAALRNYELNGSDAVDQK